MLFIKRTVGKLRDTLGLAEEQTAAPLSTAPASATQKEESTESEDGGLEDDIAMSEVDELESDADEAPHQTLTIDNHAALQGAFESIRVQKMAFSELQTLTTVGEEEFKQKGR